MFALAVSTSQSFDTCEKKQVQSEASSIRRKGDLTQYGISRERERKLCTHDVRLSKKRALVVSNTGLKTKSTP